jgi:hypothetical protein
MDSTNDEDGVDLPDFICVDNSQDDPIFGIETESSSRPKHDDPAVGRVYRHLAILQRMNPVFRAAWDCVITGHAANNYQHGWVVVANAVRWFESSFSDIQHLVRIWSNQRDLSVKDETVQTWYEAGQRELEIAIKYQGWETYQQRRTRLQRERRQVGRLNAARRESNLDQEGIHTSEVLENLNTVVSYRSSLVVLPGARTVKILELKAQGKSYPKIAAELGIKEQTVATLVQRAKKKAEKLAQPAAEEEDWGFEATTQEDWDAIAAEEAANPAPKIYYPRTRKLQDEKIYDKDEKCWMHIYEKWCIDETGRKFISLMADRIKPRWSTAPRRGKKK